VTVLGRCELGNQIYTAVCLEGKRRSRELLTGESFELFRTPYGKPGPETCQASNSALTLQELADSRLCETTIEVIG
jgi:hypothetical protein